MAPGRTASVPHERTHHGDRLVDRWRFAASPALQRRPVPTVEDARRPGRARTRCRHAAPARRRTWSSRSVTDIAGGFQTVVPRFDRATRTARSGRLATSPPRRCRGPRERSIRPSRASRRQVHASARISAAMSTVSSTSVHTSHGRNSTVGQRGRRPYVPVQVGGVLDRSDHLELGHRGRRTPPCEFELRRHARRRPPLPHLGAVAVEPRLHAVPERRVRRQRQQRRQPCLARGSRSPPPISGSSTPTWTWHPQITCWRAMAW